MKHYKAPWGILLIVMSILLTALCLGIALVEFRHEGPASRVGWLLVALVAGCALFTIRGYTITPDAILVHRLGWVTWLPRAGLQSARFEPRTSWVCIRIGNGGFFSFTGLTWSPRLGLCRVFFTDRNRCVVLQYPNRKVVVSPDAPEDFIRDLAVTRPSMD